MRFLRAEHRFTQDIIYVVMCPTTFALGSAFFDRFTGVLADYE